MTIFVLSHETAELTAHADKSTVPAGNHNLVFSSVEDIMNIGSLTRAALAAINGQFGGSDSLAKDKPTAAKRLMDTLTMYVEGGGLKVVEGLSPVVPEAKGEMQMTDAEVFGDDRKAEQESKDGRGRTKGSHGKHVGKTLKGTHLHTNPRRFGTHGWKSYELIREAGAEGISYADYMAKGGRTNDLAWDIQHGFVVVQG